MTESQRYLCNVNVSELTHGGKKTPGKDALLASNYADWTTEEIVAEIQRLTAEGFWLQVRIDAQRDRRKQVAKDTYPAPWQKTARWYSNGST